MKSVKNWRITLKKSKKSTKKDKFEVPPQGVDQILHVNQILHVDQLWGAGKIWKKTFFCSFSDVFCWFQPWNHWKKGLKSTRKIENGWKKVVTPAFRCCNHLKAGWNTQHTDSQNFTKKKASQDDRKKMTELDFLRWPNKEDRKP